MSSRNNWINWFLRSGFSVFLLPIFYVIFFNTINFPPVYLFVVFLIALISIRVKLNGKARTIFTSFLYFICSWFIIRSYIQEPRHIVGNTMLPTLQFNDRVLVDKFKYFFQDPQHGDIIMFLGTEKEKTFVNRIIGLPFERVEIREGRVYINEKLLQENYSVNPSNSQSNSMKIPYGVYLVLPDNRKKDK